MTHAKKWMVALGAMFAIGTSAYAAPETVVRVLRDSTTIVALNLNTTTVFCTARGYGTVQLKVSVPDLAWLAHFDHRVVGETEPCMTAGVCNEQNGPSRIISSTERLAVVPVRVILTENLVIDEEAKTCTSRLSEEVKSNVRGVDFQHFKSEGPKADDFERCLKIRRL